ncbi:MAG: hypothetical protein RL637_158 [Pseudomonadota bacterium]|jgi:predicted GTPase
MAYVYSEFIAQIQQWATQVVEAQWLTATQIAELLPTHSSSPHLWLNDVEQHPLVVAFMGGTGVGKSSLLNRLAAATIAQAGIERPTSTEVTLYHHIDVDLTHLPAELTTETLKMTAHQQTLHKNILWLDMPDFDSSTREHNQLMLKWLSYIDVLIYVVSPERYRDRKAWQLLQTEAAHHAWLFVFNQWDKAHIAQYHDFKQLLTEAGFSQAFIFRTVCGQTHPSDEFISLQNTLTALATERQIQQLQRYQQQYKIIQLRQKLQNCLCLWATEHEFEQWQTQWQTYWLMSEKLLTQGIAWSLPIQAQHYANWDLALYSKPLMIAIWDEWTQTRFNDALDELILIAQPLHISTLPLKARLNELRSEAKMIMQKEIEWQCRLALHQPGNVFQRWGLKIVNIANIIAPLLSLLWVAYQVFNGYYQSSHGNQAYLGLNFVTHSLLLIVMSGLLPYFLQQKLQPSLEQTALRGLKKGWRMGLTHLSQQIENMIQIHWQQQQLWLTQLNGYIHQCESLECDQKIDKTNPLSRMLVD